MIGGTSGASTTTYTTDGNGFVTGFSQVVGLNGTDTLTSIENLAFDNGQPGNPTAWTTLDLNKAVQLFSNGGQLVGTFDHIQDAIVAADTSGETIKVKAGTYDENVNVNKTGLTIIGAGDLTIIHGTFKSENGIADGQVAAFLESGAPYTQNAGRGRIGSSSALTSGRDTTVQPSSSSPSMPTFSNLSATRTFN